MSDRFYRAVRWIGGHPFLVSGRPIVLGVEHVPREGAFILAATHGSAYDVPVLIHHTPRLLDFVSTTEVFSNRFAAWLYGNMNAFPLERSRPDVGAARRIVSRLRAGRAVAMFPEGRIQAGEGSVVRTGKIRRGLGRIAQMTGAPVVPCVLIGTGAYGRPAAWLPRRGTRYGVIYGPPIAPTGVDAEGLEAAYVEAVVGLYRELAGRMGEGE